MTNNNNNTFFKVTNRDIYDKIETLIESNTKDHAEIVLHQKQTNGKVKLNRWIATTALMLIVTLFGYFVKLII